LRQQRIEQLGLPRFQRVALAAPEEGALRGIVVVVAFVHAAVVRRCALMIRRPAANKEMPRFREALLLNR
jgi:hypothetical protein